MKIGLLSDTHGYLDERFFSLFANVDEVWHAGDFGNAELSERISSFKPLRGVYGNIDGNDVRALHPLHTHFEIETVKVYMTHIGGYPGNYFPEAFKQINSHQPKLFICGHSHICKIMSDAKNNLLHINPGAAGNHGFHKMKTAVRFEINKGKIENVEVIELGLRGSLKN